MLEDTSSPSLAPSDPDDAALRARYIDAARRWAPPGFAVEKFWFDLLGSFDLSLPGKLNVIYQMSNGYIPPDEILALREEVDEDVKRWNGLLGVETSEAVRAMVRRHRPDPRDPIAMASLPPGSPDEEAAVLLYAFVRVAGVEEVSAEERLDLLRRSADAGPALPDVQRCLAKMTTIMALEAPDPERKEALLRQALDWVSRAQRQAPEDPLVNDNAAYILEELSVLCGEEEATRLLTRAAECCAVVLGCAGTYSDSGSIERQAIVGLAMANWQLGVNAEDPEEARHRLAESLAQMQRAVGMVGPEECNQVRFYTGAVALDLAWAETETEARRRAFEAAREAFAAVEPEVGAQEYQAVPLLGLAALSRGDQRRRLAEQASGYLAMAAGPGEGDGVFPPRAWLYFAAAPGVTEGLEGPELAVTAARRGLEREPGGRYALACALSLAGQVEAAAGELEAALEHDSRVAQEALADPDLAPLLAARPDLRAALERRVA